MIESKNISPLTQDLNAYDFDELNGFAHYHRPFEATYATLCRLVRYNQKHQQSRKPQPQQQLTLPVLSALIKSKNNQSLLISSYQLAGKNALMQTIKQEIKTWLAIQISNS